jgi:hypothetical protein
MSGRSEETTLQVIYERPYVLNISWMIHTAYDIFEPIW